MRARLAPLTLALFGLLLASSPEAAEASRTPSRARRAKDARRAVAPAPVPKPARVARARVRQRHLVGHRANPLLRLPPGPADRVVFGVMGGAGSSTPRRVQDASFEVGREIAGGGDVILTGASPGLPDDAVRGARSRGGLAIGISPHDSLDAHLEAGSPDDFDVLQFTELPPALAGQRRPNYMGREIDNIVRSDAIIVVGGRTGTLGELAIAVEEQRPIGVLTGSGGMADIVKDILAASTRAGKPPGAPVLYDSNPQRLVRRLRRATLAFRAAGGASGPLGDK